MKRLRIFPAFLKTILAVVFILAGGSFSHSIAESPHHHEQEMATPGGHVHDHASSGMDRHLSDHETVHCGAYLLALTPDEPYLVPELRSVAVSTSLSTAVSRIGSLDPPPPRTDFLSN